ncbi:MAG: hypothetical protein F4X12_21325 [Acidobacteriia bacterium]|nr:hypothetical protein [Terriglobia bacterium]
MTAELIGILSVGAVLLGLGMRLSSRLDGVDRRLARVEGLLEGLGLSGRVLGVGRLGSLEGSVWAGSLIQVGSAVALLAFFTPDRAMQASRAPILPTMGHLIPADLQRLESSPSWASTLNRMHSGLRVDLAFCR